MPDEQQPSMPPTKRPRGRPRKYPKIVEAPEELEEPREAAEEAPEEAVAEEIENAEPEVSPELPQEAPPEIAPENSSKRKGKPMTLVKAEVAPDPIEKAPDKNLFQVERMSPVNVALPNGEVVSTKGQSWEFTGAYTRDQVEDLVKEHGGKGIYGISARDYRTNKVSMNTWLYKVENGEVNTPAVLADMYPLKARQLIKAGLMSPEGVLADFADAAGPRFNVPDGDDDELVRPESHAQEDQTIALQASSDESPEAAMLRKELLELQEQQSVEQLRATVAEQRRMVHERSVRRKQVEAEVEDEISSGRTSTFRRRRHQEDDDPDRPMTRAEQEMAALKAQVAALTSQLSQKPQDGGLSSIATLMIESNKNGAEVMKEIAKASTANEAKNRELMMDIMKMSMEKSAAMVSQGDKQFELMLKMLDVKEDRKGSEMAHMIKLMEFGANMRESGSAEGVPWWQELLGGIGQLGGVVAEKLGGGQSAAANFAVSPRPALPASNPQVLPMQPQPRLPGAVHFEPGQVQSAEAVVMPSEQPQVQEPEGQNVDDKTDLGETVTAIIDSIMAQKDAKPTAAEWVEIAYQDLPYEIIKQIALAQDPKELLPLAEPYIGIGLKLKAGAIIQSDPMMVPWLKAGWTELQIMCRDKVSEMEPGAINPQEDNVQEQKEGA